MHSIHHSSHQPETDSNYGQVFSGWDRLFGTYTAEAKTDRRNREIGLKEIRDRRTAFSGGSSNLRCLTFADRRAKRPPRSLARVPASRRRGNAGLMPLLRSGGDRLAVKHGVAKRAVVFAPGGGSAGMSKQWDQWAPGRLRGEARRRGEDRK